MQKDSSNYQQTDCLIDWYDKSKAMPIHKLRAGQGGGICIFEKGLHLGKICVYVVWGWGGGEGKVGWDGISFVRKLLNLRQKIGVWSKPARYWNILSKSGVHSHTSHFHWPPPTPLSCVWARYPFLNFICKSIIIAECKGCVNVLLETVCMKCQSLFSGKNRKNISNCHLLKILPRVLKR